MSGITGWFRSLGIYGYLLIGLLIGIAVYFIIEHQVHLAAYSSLIFLAIFFGLHLVMCGMGHGSHGGKEGGSCGGSHEGHGSPGTSTDKKEPEKSGGADEENERKGGSCH